MLHKYFIDFNEIKLFHSRNYCVVYKITMLFPTNENPTHDNDIKS